MEGPLILDRYRPLADLGEGGFGSVELAWDTRMQRRVAIKRLPLPLDASGRAHRPPGLAEARTAALLSHPAIVTVFDFDTDDDEAFLVMEYVDGISLGNAMRSVGGPLTLDEAGAVVAAVASALAFAHDNGVLHLDIKPENVLITRDGRIKVADFGISALSSLSGHDAAFGGTLGYMPAEQLSGSPVSEKTDGWALAAMTFEMLAGGNPYAKATPADSLRAAQADPPELARYQQGLPQGLDDVLFTELSPQPEERYPDVDALSAALLECLGDEQLGCDSLAGIVGEVLEDETGGEYGLDEVGLWDRAGLRIGPWLLRLAAGAESAWMGWLGLASLGVAGVALYGAIALMAVAGILAPSLGVGIGFAAWVASLYASAAWPAALALTVGGCAWWWFVARHHDGAAVLPLSAPAFGIARLGYTQPLLAGFSLEPLPAAVTALLGGALTMLASAATLQTAPYAVVEPAVILDPTADGLAAHPLGVLLTSPAAYVALAGWPIAAAAMSLACRRATRTSALLGMIGGVIALAGTAILAGRLAAIGGDSDAASAWSGSAMGWALGASSILMLAVIALGAPLRGEED